jgi:polar amino acid transport system ATP-binding protein
MVQLEKIKLFFFKNSVSLDLQKGEILGVLGPSGSGKTTFLKSIKGFLPKEGTVLLNNEIITDKEDYRIAFVHQQPILYDHWSIIDNLICGNIYLRHQKKEDVLKKLYKITDLFNLTNLLNKKVHELSLGQKQRLSIIRCLMMDPKLIIMDEPSSALDPCNIKKLSSIIQKLKKSGISIILASHDMNFINSICDKILFLNNNGETLFNGSLSEFLVHEHPVIKDFIG